MTEEQALALMVPPGKPRPGKWRQGVIQILLTSSCNLGCYSCTQGSQLQRKPWFMTPPQFEKACQSLKGYWGVVGVFGGNPTVSKYFEECCDILCKYFPREQRGLWSNAPLGKGAICRRTFDPSISNLNCHLDQSAYDEFKSDWPESMPFGNTKDSRHSPPLGSMYKIEHDEGKRWELISNCDINQHWSASIGVFRGELRAWFCEIAMAQSILKQHDPEYPDTGVPVEVGWWEKPMQDFARQVRWHCHRCLVPLRGYGELSQAEHGVDQTTEDYADVFRPKDSKRPIQIVTTLEELKAQSLKTMTHYLQNGAI